MNGKYPLVHCNRFNSIKSPLLLANMRIDSFVSEQSNGPHNPLIIIQAFVFQYVYRIVTYFHLKFGLADMHGHCLLVLVFISLNGLFTKCDKEHLFSSLFLSIALFLIFSLRVLNEMTQRLRFHVTVPPRQLNILNLHQNQIKRCEWHSKSLNNNRNVHRFDKLTCHWQIGF